MSAAAGALEQLGSFMMFGFSDATTQCRLPDGQRLRRPSEAMVLRYEERPSEIPKFEAYETTPFRPNIYLA